MKKEITKIDNKYSIEIVDNGSTVNLLRYDEDWFENHPQGKVFIAVASKITELEQKVDDMKCCTNCVYGKGSHDCNYPDAMYTNTFGHSCNKWEFLAGHSRNKELKLKENENGNK